MSPTWSASPLPVKPELSLLLKRGNGIPLPKKNGVLICFRHIQTLFVSILERDHEKAEFKNHPELKEDTNALHPRLVDKHNEIFTAELKTKRGHSTLLDANSTSDKLPVPSWSFLVQ